MAKNLNFTEIDNFILLQQLVTDNFPKTNYSRKLASFSVLRNSYKVLAEQFKVLVEMQLLKRYFPYKELLHRYFRCFFSEFGNRTLNLVYLEPWFSKGSP